jgi:hypothetical protein
VIGLLPSPFSWVFGWGSLIYVISKWIREFFFTPRSKESLGWIWVNGNRIALPIAILSLIIWLTFVLRFMIEEDKIVILMWALMVPITMFINVWIFLISIILLTELLTNFTKWLEKPFGDKSHNLKI